MPHLQVTLCLEQDIDMGGYNESNTQQKQIGEEKEKGRVRGTIVFQVSWKGYSRTCLHPFSMATTIVSHVHLPLSCLTLFFEKI